MSPPPSLFPPPPLLPFLLSRSLLLNHLSTPLYYYLCIYLSMNLSIHLSLSLCICIHIIHLSIAVYPSGLSSHLCIFICM